MFRLTKSSVPQGDHVYDDTYKPRLLRKVRGSSSNYRGLEDDTRNVPNTPNLHLDYQ